MLLADVVNTPPLGVLTSANIAIIETISINTSISIIERVGADA